MVYFKNTSSAALVFHKKDKHLQIAVYFCFSENTHIFIPTNYSTFTFHIVALHTLLRLRAKVIDLRHEKG